MCEGRRLHFKSDDWSRLWFQSEESLRRLGLLAVAGSDSDVLIYR